MYSVILGLKLEPRDHSVTDSLERRLAQSAIKEHTNAHKLKHLIIKNKEWKWSFSAIRDERQLGFSVSW